MEDSPTPRPVSVDLFPRHPRFSTVEERPLPWEITGRCSSQSSTPGRRQSIRPLSRRDHIAGSQPSSSYQSLSPCPWSGSQSAPPQVLKLHRRLPQIPHRPQLPIPIRPIPRPMQSMVQHPHSMIPLLRTTTTHSAKTRRFFPRMRQQVQRAVPQPQELLHCSILRPLPSGGVPPVAPVGSLQQLPRSVVSEERERAYR